MALSNMNSRKTIILGFDFFMVSPSSYLYVGDQEGSVFLGMTITLKSQNISGMNWKVCEKIVL